MKEYFFGSGVEILRTALSLVARAYHSRAHSLKARCHQEAKKSFGVVIFVSSFIAVSEDAISCFLWRLAKGAEILLFSVSFWLPIIIQS